MDCPSFDANVQSLNLEDIENIKKDVCRHGVLQFKNQDLRALDLISLTKRFGRPVLLPESLRFNNTYAEFPELARVSNVLPDNETIIDQYKGAEYWHSDGDFWQPGENFIFNFLYCLETPSQGGETGFADLRLAYESLPNRLSSAINDINIRVSCKKIPDFDGVPEEDQLPDAVHHLIHDHPISKRKGLYFGGTFAEVDGWDDKRSQELISDLMNYVDTPKNTYIHKWSVGDLLIWDNTSVMHRGMGNYGNERRVLYRTQSFISR